jgi:hypothetical protein
MTLRSGLVVLIKCFMIGLGLQLALWIVGAAVGGVVPLRFVAMTALALLPLMLVYWGAEPVVDMMTPSSNETLADPPVRAGDLQAIAFSAIGAFILYTAIQQTIYLVLYAWQMKTSGVTLAAPIDLYTNPVVSWIVGLYLLAGAPHIRPWLGRMRRTGPNVE